MSLYVYKDLVKFALVEIFREVDQIATALGIRFFVAGAMGRGIVIEFCHAIRLARGTRHLDP